MARLVEAKSAGTGIFKSETGEKDGSDGDDYGDRLIKYVPAESVAFFILVDRMIASNFDIKIDGALPTDPTAWWASAAIFALALIGTPIYFYRQRKEGKPWGLHVIIATIAFIAWSYSIGGTFWIFMDWYSAFLAALAAPVVSFVAGFFSPAEA